MNWPKPPSPTSSASRVGVPRRQCLQNVDRVLWTSALENPKGTLPFSGELPTPGEAAYAQWAAKTPHIVVSRTRKRQDVKWNNTRVISDLEEIRKLKGQTGKVYLIYSAKSR